MVKKEINHLLGRDAIYRALSGIDDLNEKISKLNGEIVDTRILIDGIVGTITDVNNKLDNKLYLIQKNTETVQEYLSNEYVALYNKMKSKKPRVLVCGFYGAKNVGDELMLEALLNLLPKGKLDITILLSNNYDIDASEYAPYKVLHYPKHSSDILAIAENFDVMIWGGGAVLDDEEYMFRGQYSTIAYILMSIAKAILKLNGQVFVYGVSSNKGLSDPHFLSDLKYIVEHSDYFSLRDTNSFDTLRRAGINTKKIEVIDDLSLISLKDRKIKLSAEKKRLKRIAINLIIFDKNLIESKRIINNIIDYFGEQSEFYFVPFYNYNNNDMRLLGDLCNDLKKRNIRFKITELPNNMDELLNIYKECDYIFVMRYHAALIAAMVHDNVVMIDYQKKHQHYTNKNNYIKMKYAPDLLVMDYDVLSKKGALKNIEICGAKPSDDFIQKIYNDTAATIKKTFGKIKRKAVNEDK